MFQADNRGYSVCEINEMLIQGRSLIDSVNKLSATSKRQLKSSLQTLYSIARDKLTDAQRVKDLSKRIKKLSDFQSSIAYWD